MINIVRPSSVGLTINRCSVPQRQGSVRTVDEERGWVDVGIVRQPGRVSIHPPSIGHIECRTSHCSTNKSKILNWSSISSLTNQVIFFFSSICLTVTVEDWLKQHLEHLTYTGFVWDDDSLFQHNDLGVLEQFEAVVTLTHIAPIGVYTVMVTGVCSLTFINI